MRRILLTAFVAFAASAALAQPPAADPQAPAAAAAAAETIPAPLNDRTCLRHTGSRIVASRNAQLEQGKAANAKPVCANVSGRSYTRDDLERTGRTNIADALRMLDPSVN